MNSHPPAAPEAPNHRRLLYIFLFAVLVRLSIFPLAVVLGGNFDLLPFADPLESYPDFIYYYMPDASSFIAGLTPYQQFPYAYPPFFLYVSAPFALFSLPFWTMALPLVVFDAATVIPVFLIANKLMNPRRAVMASIAFAVAPINLFYYDFLWLNGPPMTFFTVLAVYAFVSRKHGTAFVCLAIATLFKQVAIVLFPVFIVTMLNESNRRGGFRGAALYGTTCFVGSLPYIVTIPVEYLRSLGGAFSVIGSPAPSFPYYLGAPTSLAWAFGDDAYYPAEPLLLAALLLSFVVLCWRMHKTRVVGDMRFVTCILYALLLFSAFFPRGIYKYYLASITPFGALFIRGGKTAAIFLALNLLVLIVPRILTPWLVLLLLVVPVIKTHIARRSSSHEPQISVAKVQTKQRRQTRISTVTLKHSPDGSS